MISPEDLTGRRVGSLVVESVLADRRNRERLWLCRCDCGKRALRTTAGLKRAEKNHNNARCSACQRTDLLLVKRSNVWNWLRLWQRHQTLYSEASLSRIERDIRTAVGEECGGWQQRKADPLETSYACEEADPGASDGMTLEAIGCELGCSRERVRQILNSAMQKLRRLPELQVLVGRRETLSKKASSDQCLAVDIAHARAQGWLNGRPSRAAGACRCWHPSGQHHPVMGVCLGKVLTDSGWRACTCERFKSVASHED